MIRKHLKHVHANLCLFYYLGFFEHLLGVRPRAGYGGEEGTAPALGELTGAIIRNLDAGTK